MPGGQANILKDTQVGKDVGDLEGSADATMRSLVQRQARDVLTLEEHLTASRFGIAAEQVEKVVLPAPLGPMIECNEPCST